MQDSYENLLLNRASMTMAHMLDFAVHYLRQDAGEFFALFLSSGLAAEFGRGDIRTISGFSGVELAYRVLRQSGIAVDRVSYRYTSGRSREYWAGWALARYQHESGRSFADITDAMPVRDIIALSDKLKDQEIREIRANLDWMENLKIPDHMNEDGYEEFRSKLDQALSAVNHSGETALKRIRQLNGLSQSRLAALSGIPVRTIQQYEQRQKDINKAAFESIIKLAAALGCEPYVLLEH